jgi:3-methyladenine DNA glycosylase/8-oxoguanine DNA glycosylase
LKWLERVKPQFIKANVSRWSNAISAGPIFRNMKKGNNAQEETLLGYEFDPKGAVEHLSKADPTLSRLMNIAGPFRMEIRSIYNPFEALARNIIYQQLNGTAAQAIHARALALFGKSRLRPQDILEATDEALRGAGLSRNKIMALRDLSEKTIDGSVPALARLKRMQDEEIIETLTKVRGIGRWTVEMLLMSRLGRPDVLPVGDYGVRKGFSITYGAKDLPTPKQLAQFAEKWRPYRTVASWYMWRAVELAQRESLSDKK